ncbi:hypothetical protein [Croceicoccus naphthovorans]|uniref:Uncharacterized protein n=1 Tax=Croceicoccus naphthovorans TaxID=1348774 RepID=A0A0G3XL44_9SPHN|nr:hypothetical protein [Croceicoccus naphthovorans]AKM12215.1 hypothetical protein AB433_18975 [Croceicoccus naphthovorans]EZP69622.1 hypothetical protein BV96_04025 [Sphingomonas paucimobilis]MBB3991030.1 TPP-dependent indolepyruvate ferredoxin oxidoreductase alpha subunit [Croceicoccus naphthovorans]
MKIYLSLALFALGAQPALASSPVSSNAQAAADPGISIASVRAQGVQRVADALSAEMGTKAGATTREPVEVLKARVKAMKRPVPSDAPPPCEDCPEKVTEPRPSSASQARNHDCIDCVEEAILA